MYTNLWQMCLLNFSADMFLYQNVVIWCNETPDYRMKTLTATNTAHTEASS